MFHPETEDMLPRTAPKPTIGISKEPTARPTVPEVSLLFNQLANPAVTTTTSANGSNDSMPTKTIQSYASWKRSALPKLVNTAVTNTHCRFDTLNQQIPISKLNVESNSVDIQKSMKTVATNLCSCNHNSSIGSGNGVRLTEIQYPREQQRHSLDTFLQHNSEITRDRLASTHYNTHHQEVLTVCASTQTDFQHWSFSHSLGKEIQQITDLPTKQDYKDLLTAMQDMRIEQQRLMQICCMLLEQHQEILDKNKRAVVLKDVNTQYDEGLLDLQKQKPLIKKIGYIDERSSEMNTRGVLPPNVPPIIPNCIIQSPDDPNTGAKSAKYYVNAQHATDSTNQLAQQVQPEQTRKNKVNREPQKQVTDQTLAMNQLALKYLPNNKLSELLRDMNMTTGNEPNHEGDHHSCQQGSTSREHSPSLSKGANDISNTSYRYLKKYRLLPEVQDVESCVSPTRQFNNNIEKVNKPLVENLCSPRYDDILDLDAIRKQPKFL